MLSTWKNYTGSLCSIILTNHSSLRYPIHWRLLIRMSIHIICGNITVQVIVSLAFINRHLHDLNRRKHILIIGGFVHEISVIGIYLYWRHHGHNRRKYFRFETVAKRLPIFKFVVEFKGVITTV